MTSPRDKNKKTAVKKSPLYKELSQYQNEGIQLWLNGKPGTPVSITKACLIKEEGMYMREYYCDEQEQIYGIGFNKL